MIACVHEYTNTYRATYVANMQLHVHMGEMSAYRSCRVGFSFDLFLPGAGSCLEALGARKRLIVVVNEDLMNNHQTELADRLHIDGHVFRTTCRYEVLQHV